MLSIKSFIIKFAVRRREQFVVEDVVLTRDRSCLEVEDSPNCGVMVHGGSKAHATPGALGPLGNLLLVLKPRIEDEGRASPYTSTLEEI